MKKLLLVVWVLLQAVLLKAEKIELSDSARVSLLTVAPGEELYAAFGHTAIRVTDFKNEFDVVFNYGTFDFAQPGFYTNFVKGSMRYMITADRFSDFYSQYVWEKRRVTEQELRLTNTEMKQVFDFLYWNAQPENREYLYDFFWDNCATRPRDVFEKTLGPKLQYDYTVLDSTKTMRETLHEYVWNRPWIQFGFDLILGMPCEIKATPRNQTFLPDRLAKLYSHATLNGEKFVHSEKVLLDLPTNSLPYSGFTPVMFTSLLLVVGVLLGWRERKTGKHYRWFDAGFFFVLGFLGTLFLCLWAFTSHYSVPRNLNVLWLVPTHLPISLLLLKKRYPSVLRPHFLIVATGTLLLMIGWNALPQSFNTAVMPLLVLIVLRSITIAQFVKKQHARA